MPSTRGRSSRSLRVELLESRLLLSVVPNDPGFSSQWGLHNTNNVDIDAPEAWGITTGSSSVTVAIIENYGVQLSHPDLDSKMSPDSWNYIDGSTNQNVSTGHGTNIAGIIGAESNNGQGMAGVSWGSSVIALRTSGPTQFVNAIKYAADKGVKAIAFGTSFGGSSSSLLDAIDYAAARGVVVVAAAGNGGTSGLTSQPGQNLDTTPTYPAAYSRPNLISVAAVDSSGNLASFSNYSSSKVHVGAPGVDIYTTEWTGGYINFAAGTSFATPFVAGVVALVASQYPNYTAAQLVQAVTQNVKPLASLAGKTISGGMVSAYNALLSGMPAPTAVATPASVVNATTTNLSVNASYGGGDSGLTYTWSVVSKPSGAADPTFSANGTNAAKNAVATFSATGSYTFQLTVTNGSGFVRTSYVPVTVTNSGAPSNPAFLDDGQSAAEGVTRVGNWTQWTGGGQAGTHSTAPTGDGSTKMTWTFNNLPQGVYEVWVNWVQAPNRATNSPFTVYNGNTPLTTVRVDQTKAPVGYYDASSSWNTLGERFTIDSGSLKVVLSNDADAGANVVADSVRIRKLGPWLADDSQTSAEGFSKTGSWSQWTGSGVASTHSTAQGGDGSTTATWTFTDLAPGKYQVWATWIQASNRATNSPFTVYDSTTSRGTIAVDQTQAPTGVFTSGLSWKSLFENITIQNGTLVVKLTNAGVDPSRAIVADAIRIQRVGGYFADDTDGSPIYQKTTGWTRWDGSGFSNTHSTAPGGYGEINATWTFENVTPGVYEVWATWIQAPNRATNSPFTIYDGTNSLGTVLVNQQSAPTGYYDGAVSFVSLGQSFLVTSGALKVMLSNAGVVNGQYVVADAIRINRVDNPPGGVVVPFSVPVGLSAMASGSSEDQEAAPAIDPVEVATFSRTSPRLRNASNREKPFVVITAASRPFRAWGDPGRPMRRGVLSASTLV